MIALLHSTYPATVTAKLIETYLSRELPPRPDGVKELGSIVYSDAAGTHTVLLLEVDDRVLPEYVRSQVERVIFMQTRVEGFRVETHFGYSVMDTISMAAKLAPK